jgi:hypothetical protein
MVIPDQDGGATSSTEMTNGPLQVAYGPLNEKRANV